MGPQDVCAHLAQGPPAACRASNDGDGTPVRDSDAERLPCDTINKMGGDKARHARWAVTDANVRTRATLQVFRFLTGDIGRIPTTAVEVYAELVDHFFRTNGSDLAAGLEKKIDDTKTTVEEVKEELAEVKDRLQYTTGLLEAVYRRDGMPAQLTRTPDTPQETTTDTGTHHRAQEKEEDAVALLLSLLGAAYPANPSETD